MKASARTCCHMWRAQEVLRDAKKPPWPALCLKHLHHYNNNLYYIYT